MIDQAVAISHARRRSVDVGGLSHAIKNPGLGHGWGGWEEGEQGEVRYAELLSGMYLQTEIAVHENRCKAYECSAPDLPQSARSSLIRAVSRWTFEPHKLRDEQVVSCTMILFEALFRVEGMQQCAGVSLLQIRDFVYHLRRIYREQNSYHNFHHALDVLQATYHFLCSAGRVPSVKILLKPDKRPWRLEEGGPQGLISCLTNYDVLALYIAAIGHDVGHPGFTNNFMKNAKTPLSAVYDDKSALEHMHCALLVRLMREHGLGQLLDRPESGNAFRMVLQRSVLATDMSVHGDFMSRFEALVVDAEQVTLEQKKVLICQALIKCADISNPSRPHRVSRYWAGALMEEWTCQATLEKHCHLPATVSPAGDSVAEARGQVWFITTFTKPLLELTAQGVPRLRQYVQCCAINLEQWQVRARADSSSTVLEDVVAHTTTNSSSSESASSSSSPLSSRSSSTAPQLPEDFLNVFPLTLPPSMLCPNEASSSSVWAGAGPRFDGAHPPPPLPPPLLPSTESSVSSSEGLTSPCEMELVIMPSPTPSSTGTTGAGCCAGPCGGSVGGGRARRDDATAAIRAAYRASVRKKRGVRNRNSWGVVGSLGGSGSGPVVGFEGAALCMRGLEVKEVQEVQEGEGESRRIVAPCAVSASASVGVPSGA